MKKLLFPVAFVLMFGMTAAPVFADRGESEASEHRASESFGIRLGVRIGAKVQEVKDDIASRSASFVAQVRERLSASRTQRIREWWSRVQTRLSDIATRESAVADRLQQRIDQLKSDGHDTTQSQADLDAARVKITVATQSIASASATVDGILTNDTPSDAFKALHDMQKSLLATLKGAHSALVRVLVEIRGVAASPSPSPSPTP